MSPLSKFPPADFQEFFRALDRELRRPLTVTVIGGAAIGLKYDPRHATSDIDLRVDGHRLYGDAREAGSRSASSPLSSACSERALRNGFSTASRTSRHHLWVACDGSGLGSSEGHLLGVDEDGGKPQAVHARRPADEQVSVRRAAQRRSAPRVDLWTRSLRPPRGLQYFDGILP
jgi:hypothetical protein